MAQFASTLYPQTKAAPSSPEFWTEKNKRRFDSKLKESGECLIWTAGNNGHGYGTFYATPGARVKAHRAAWMREKGFISSDVMLDHICRNTLCVRVSHLRIVDYKQNRENLSGAYANSKTGIRGVYYVKRTGRYRAEVQHNGKQHIAGNFKRIEDAEAAALELRNRLFTHNEADRGGDA